MKANINACTGLVSFYFEMEQSSDEEDNEFLERVNKVTDFAVNKGKVVENG